MWGYSLLDTNEMIGIIILAAGEGKRMKSDKAKVLHELGGKPMIDYVLETASALEPAKIAVVVGNRMEQVISHLRGKRVVFCVQLEQKGTAHAVLSAQGPFVGFSGQIAVLCGDMPLLEQETLKKLYEYHILRNAVATVLTGTLENPAQYGRIIRNSNGDIERIVEFSDADSETRKINEVNSGTYIFDSDELWGALAKIESSNMQGEFYLTDIIELFRKDGKIVAGYKTENSYELMGINNFEQLAEAEEVIENRRRE